MRETISRELVGGIQQSPTPVKAKSSNHAEAMGKEDRTGPTHSAGTRAQLGVGGEAGTTRMTSRVTTEVARQCHGFTGTNGGGLGKRQVAKILRTEYPQRYPDGDAPLGIRDQSHTDQHAQQRLPRTLRWGSVEETSQDRGHKESQDPAWGPQAGRALGSVGTPPRQHLTDENTKALVRACGLPAGAPQCCLLQQTENRDKRL